MLAASVCMCVCVCGVSLCVWLTQKLLGQATGGWATFRTNRLLFNIGDNKIFLAWMPWLFACEKKITKQLLVGMTDYLTPVLEIAYKEKEFHRIWGLYYRWRQPDKRHLIAFFIWIFFSDAKIEMRINRWCRNKFISWRKFPFSSIQAIWGG